MSFASAIPNHLSASAGDKALQRAQVSIRQRLSDWRLALAAVLLLAVVVRVANLGHNSLSHAEASRVNVAWSTTWDNARWFPPAQYALLWIVRHATSGSEIAMRMPSALAGITCIIAVFLFTNRFFGPWAGVCAAALACGHAELVAHSRMVKEFSLEGLFSTLIFWAAVEACRSKSARSLRWFTATALAGACLTYTWPLMVVGWAPVLVWTFWRGHQSGSLDGLRNQPIGSGQWGQGTGVREQDLRRTMWRCGVVIGVAITAWYLWFNNCFNRQGASHDYGVIRGAWPVAYDFHSLAAWLSEQSYGALQFALGISDLYAPINWLIGGYLLLLASAAWSELRSQAPWLLVGLAGVITITMFAGAVRAWPYGRFHTLLFLVPPVCVTTGVGLKVLIERIRMPVPVFVLVAVCLLNPAARAVKNTVVHPSESEHLRPILEYVSAHAQPGDGLFSYYAGCHAVKYYWRRDDVPVLLQPTDDRDQSALFAERFDQFAAEHERVWFVFTHNWRNEQVEWIELLQRQFQLVDQFENATASVHLFAKGI